MIKRVTLVIAVGACAAIASGSCSSTSSATDAADAPARRAMFEHVARALIAPTYDDFAAQMASLEEACAALAASQDPAELEVARSAFRAAMLTWQRAEVFQVGPAARVSSQTPGGEGLRNQIYTYPARNSCGVAAALLDQSYGDVAAFEAGQFADTRALDSLEALLFDDGADPHCESENVVPAAAWAELVDSGELPARRAAYAYTVARIVREKADTLVAAFAEFIPELGAAGTTSTLFANTQEALNALTDTVFYIETETKDMKLGNPAGITADCGDGCAALAELSYSGLSRDAILANLHAFQDLFFGTGQPAAGELLSLADLLRSVSADKLADELAALTDQAIADAEAIDPSVEEAADAHAESLQTAYASAQALSTRLKTDFLATLSLSLPMNAAADSD